jgi:hypothetical protein
MLSRYRQVVPSVQLPSQGLPVLNCRGTRVGYADSAKAAKSLLGEHAHMCNVNGAVVYADPRCPPNANWSYGR